MSEIRCRSLVFVPSCYFSPLEKLKPATEEVATIKGMLDLRMPGTIGIGQLVNESAGEKHQIF